jgi:regulator of nucleoside diphosphate kinase
MQQNLETRPIVLSRADYERLASLADARNAETLWPALVDAVSRARIVPPEALPPATVTMGATIEYRDEADGETRRVTLVFPQEEDSTAGRLSVTTPVGTALIGLREGQSATWQTRGGAWKTLPVPRALRA